MPYRFSRRADEELANLYRFGIVTFGEAQADRYYDGLLEICDLIGRSPMLGRAVSDLLRPMSYRSHVIIYSIDSNRTVIIARVAHGQSNWLDDLE